MADEGIMDDKDEVEGHVATPLTDDSPDSETSDDVEGHVEMPAIGEPRDQPGVLLPKSDDKADVEGHVLLP
jgi:hypothetical protein